VAEPLQAATVARPSRHRVENDGRQRQKRHDQIYDVTRFRARSRFVPGIFDLNQPALRGSADPSRP